MKTKISIGLGALLVALLAYVAFQPSEYHISQDIVIQAPPSKIFPHINNSQLCNAWMPWAETDPQMNLTYSGPDEGVGSKALWESEGNMGVGESEVIESQVDQIVKTRLTYKSPMAMTQISEMSLTPEDGGTRVIWSIQGENNFLMRLICFVFRMDMEKHVKAEFAKGLHRLKSMMENAP